MSDKKNNIIDPTEAMYERIAPMVTELYNLIGEIPQDKFKDCADPNKRNEVVKDVVSKFITKLVKSDLLSIDTEYVFSTLYTILDAIKAGMTDTLNENTSRISEIIYGLPPKEINNLKISQINDVFQRIDVLKDTWTPLLKDSSLGKKIE